MSDALQGTAPISISAIQAIAAQSEATGRELLHLEQGEPDFGTPGHIVEAAKRALDEGHVRYVPAQGISPLRHALASAVSQGAGVVVSPEEITVTNGATLGLYLALSVTTSVGDEVMVGDPCFGQFPSIIRSRGARPVFVRADHRDGRYVLRAEDVERQVTPSTKAIILNTPDNPTGTVYSDRELSDLVDVALRHDLYIISDEVYSKIVFDGVPFNTVLSLPEARQRAIIVNSFSKSYAMTGWRLGYNVAPRGVTSAMSTLLHSSARCATSFVQYAGVAAVLGSQDCVQEMLSSYAVRREAMARALRGVPKIRFGLPEGAIYFYVDISELGLTGGQFAMDLIESVGVVVAPGDYFGPSGSNYVRLCFAVGEQTILEAVRRIRERVVELA